MKRKIVTVAADGSAEFRTLTEAAAAQQPGPSGTVNQSGMASKLWKA